MAITCSKEMDLKDLDRFEGFLAERLRDRTAEPRGGARNKNLVFIGNKNLVFIGNKNLVFIGTQNEASPKGKPRYRKSIR